MDRALVGLWAPVLALAWRLALGGHLPKVEQWVTAPVLEMNWIPACMRVYREEGWKEKDGCVYAKEASLL